MAESIGERRNKRQKLETQSSNPFDAFGLYVTQTLSELDPKVRNVARHHINTILFQAQSGNLVQNHNFGMTAPVSVHPPPFQPLHPHYDAQPVMNQPTSFNYSPLSSQRDNTAILSNPGHSPTIWSSQIQFVS